MTKTHRQVLAYLSKLTTIRNCKPLHVVVGKQRYEAVSYNDENHVDSPIIYCVGPLPKQYVRNHSIVFTRTESIDTADWYIGSYWPKMTGRTQDTVAQGIESLKSTALSYRPRTTAQALYRKFHRCGSVFQLYRWSHDGGRIDKQEPTPRTRVPFLVEDVA
jgi:hypothetical protein